MYNYYAVTLRSPPYVVLQIVPQGPVDKTGKVAVGDILENVDQIKVQGKQKLLELMIPSHHTD
jgi:hypothetical protein